MKIQACCGNCSVPFNSTLIVREIIIECPQPESLGSPPTIQYMSLKVKDVLSAIYKFSYLDEIPSGGEQEEEEEIAVCSGCAGILTQLYKNHEELSYRRQSNSYVAQRNDKLENILQEIQQTYHQMIYDDDDEDDENSSSRENSTAKIQQKMSYKQNPSVIEKKNIYMMNGHSSSSNDTSSSSSHNESMIGKKSSRLKMKEDTKREELALNSTLQFHLDDPTLTLHNPSLDSLDMNEYVPDDQDDDPLAISFYNDQFDEEVSSPLVPAGTIDDEDDVDEEEQEEEKEEEEDKQIPLTCPLCNITTLTPRALSEHLAGHVEKGTSTCPVPSCGRNFASPSYVKVHMDLHAGFKRFVCPKKSCSKTFITVGNLSRHVMTCRTQKPGRGGGHSRPSTSIIPSTSSMRGLAIRGRPIKGHAIRGARRGPGRPPNSSRMNRIENKIMKNAASSSKSKHSCPCCGRILDSAANLAAHLFTDHINKENPLICPVCSLVVSGRGPLRMHIYCHVGGKTKCFKSKILSSVKKSTTTTTSSIVKVSSTPPSLIPIHSPSSSEDGKIRTGPGKKSGRGRGRGSKLLFTMKKKKKVGPVNPISYECDVCGRSCPNYITLQIHQRIHTGEKPFVCEYENCNYRTAQSGNFKVHLLKHKKPEAIVGVMPKLEENMDVEMETEEGLEEQVPHELDNSVVENVNKKVILNVNIHGPAVTTTT